MKKIVLCTITLQPENTFKAIYSAKQKDIYNDSKYDEKIYYPINAVLANELQKDDDVKIVLIKTNDPDNPESLKKYLANKEKFVREFKCICEEKGIKSNIENPLEIESEFIEDKVTFEKRYMDLFSILEKDCEIYTDMTYGSRVTSMILMNILSFAEKFFDADLKSIVYGKASFIPSTEDPSKTVTSDDGKVYDLSYLYYLNSLTGILKADSGEEAIDAFKQFLDVE